MSLLARPEYLRIKDINIEKELTWWQRFRLRLGSVSLVLIVIAMLYLFLKFTNLLKLKL